MYRVHLSPQLGLNRRHAAKIGLIGLPQWVPVRRPWAKAHRKVDVPLAKPGDQRRFRVPKAPDWEIKYSQRTPRARPPPVPNALVQDAPVQKAPVQKTITPEGDNRHVTDVRTTDVRTTDRLLHFERRNASAGEGIYRGNGNRHAIGGQRRSNRLISVPSRRGTNIQRLPFGLNLKPFQA